MLVYLGAPTEVSVVRARHQSVLLSRTQPMHEYPEFLIYSEAVELGSSATCHHNCMPGATPDQPDQAQVHGMVSADRDQEDL